jgi:hypothetical protein
VLLLKAFLVVLIGVYAIRASWFLFSGTFSPLTPVAMAVLVLFLFVFHRPPQALGVWFSVCIAACVVGVVANTVLLFVSSPIYNNTVNQAFSVVSLISFLAVGALLAQAVLSAPNAPN